MFEVLSSSSKAKPGTIIWTRDLPDLLEKLWCEYFADVPRLNKVQIAYASPWKRRLGMIKMTLDESVSFIGINRLLRHPQVPEAVLVTTVAHEMAHYAHGFGSPLPRLFAHPHANNVIDKELEKRHLGEMARLCNQWIDQEWFTFYANRATLTKQSSC